jgi:hypothetical protein
MLAFVPFTVILFNSTTTSMILRDSVTPLRCELVTHDCLALSLWIFNILHPKASLGNADIGMTTENCSIHIKHKVYDFLPIQGLLTNRRGKARAPALVTTARQTWPWTTVNIDIFSFTITCVLHFLNYTASDSFNLPAFATYGLKLGLLSLITTFAKTSSTCGTRNTQSPKSCRVNFCRLEPGILCLT